MGGKAVFRQPHPHPQIVAKGHATSGRFASAASVVAAEVPFRERLIAAVFFAVGRGRAVGLKRTHGCGAPVGDYRGVGKWIFSCASTTPTQKISMPIRRRTRGPTRLVFVRQPFPGVGLSGPPPLPCKTFGLAHAPTPMVSLIGRDCQPGPTRSISAGGGQQKLQIGDGARGVDAKVCGCAVSCIAGPTGRFTSGQLPAAAGTRSPQPDIGLGLPSRIAPDLRLRAHAGRVASGRPTGPLSSGWPRRPE